MGNKVPNSILESLSHWVYECIYMCVCVCICLHLKQGCGARPHILWSMLQKLIMYSFFLSMIALTSLEFHDLCVGDVLGPFCSIMTYWSSVRKGNPSESELYPATAGVRSNAVRSSRECLWQSAVWEAKEQTQITLRSRIPTIQTTFTTTLLRGYRSSFSRTELGQDTGLTCIQPPSL